MTTEPYADLAFLLQAYFHQNWAVPYERAGMTPSYQQVVVDFRGAEPQRVAGVVADLDAVISQGLPESELRALSRRLGSQFYPPGAGKTYQAWFEEIRDLLTAPRDGSAG
jgi:CdiI immunity protein